MSKKTLVIIVNQQNDYLVKVKKNQKNLYLKIENQSRLSQPVQRYQEQETSRGRISHWNIEVFAAAQEIDKQWVGAKSFIKVERFGIREGQTYNTISYYMSSLSPNARKISQGIRQHWHTRKSLTLG